jgi:GTP-binding protein
MTDPSVFNRPWIFLRSVPDLKFLPSEGPPEVAFAGRSNVGKSTLINRLVGQKGLARTSNAPGRTQELNYFVPDSAGDRTSELPPLAIVDMPGYGFAKAPKMEIGRWTSLVFDYMRGRATLKRVYLLIDARRGIKANDIAIMDLLDKAAVSYQIVLTKIDKIKPPAVQSIMRATLEKVRNRPAAFPEILATSSEQGTGIQALKEAIAEATVQ